MRKLPAGTIAAIVLGVLHHDQRLADRRAAHGLLFLALTDHKGQLVWLSAVRPGRSSEMTTARYNKVVDKLMTRDVRTWEPDFGIR